MNQTASLAGVPSGGPDASSGKRTPPLQILARVPLSCTSRHPVLRSHQFAPDRHLPSTPLSVMNELRCGPQLLEALKGAQHEIATDWRAAYKKWITAKVAENGSHEGGPDAPQT
jgi:hypothetical protein